jgi:hypothetical protein
LICVPSFFSDIHLLLGLFGKAHIKFRFDFCSQPGRVPGSLAPTGGRTVI